MLWSESLCLLKIRLFKSKHSLIAPTPRPGQRACHGPRAFCDPTVTLRQRTVQTLIWTQCAPEVLVAATGQPQHQVTRTLCPQGSQGVKQEWFSRLPGLTRQGRRRSYQCWTAKWRTHGETARARGVPGRGSSRGPARRVGAPETCRRVSDYTDPQWKSVLKVSPTVARGSRPLQQHFQPLTPWAPPATTPEAASALRPPTALSPSVPGILVSPVCTGRGGI